MQRVFVSYSHINATFAERLARDLQDAGYDVWIDFQSIRGGETWRQKIFDGVKSSDFLLVCLSPDAAESTWVRDEVLMARAQDKRVIPVMHLTQTERDGQILKTLDLMADDEQLKALLEIQFVDFERHGYERAFKLLLDALPGVIRPESTIRPDSTAVETQYGESTWTGEPRTSQNPFKGLDAFQQTDAHIFFGREVLTQKLVDKLKRVNADASRFLAVVGASGSGKSSVVRAGLIPQIREAALPGSENWPLVIFTPGDQPTDALALRLLSLLGAGQLLPNVVAALESGEKALHQLTEQILADASPSVRLVLVIDQFEEVFTRASQNAAAVFLNLLYTAVTVPNGRTLVVLTMRADFFDRLSAYPDIAALFERDNLVIATEMTADELRRSIEEPARVVGLVYDHGLPDRILEEVREQPGSLPLLQYALTALYLRRAEERLTLVAYNEIEGVMGALAHHAEDIYQSLMPDAQFLMRRLLLRLVEVSETGEATRRRVHRQDLTFSNVPSEVVDRIIDRLTAPDSRLLVANREITGNVHAEPTVWLEVSHEALIREWARFRQWVADDLEMLRLSGDLLKAAGDWERNGFDQSYLLTGSRLERAEEWLSDSDASDLQRKHIVASAQAAADRRDRDEQTARRVQSLQRVRTGALIALIVAAIVAGFAILQAANAVGERQAAETAQVAAVVEQQAALETLAQVPSTFEAANRQVIQAQGTLEAIATDSQAQLNNLDSLRLAAEARTANERNEPFLALALALEAVKIPGVPNSVEKTLADLAYAPGAKKVLRGHSGTVSSVAFSPDGNLALSGSSDNTLMLWDVSSGQVLRAFHGHSGTVYSVAFSPDGVLALSGSDDGTLMLWEVSSGQALRAFHGHSDWVRGVAFSPDGILALSGSSDNTLMLWEVASGQALRTFHGHSGWVDSVAFSPDGKLVLSGSDDGTLMLWEVSSGQVLRTFYGHSSLVSSVAFSPDGVLALSGSSDNTLMLWEVASGQMLRTFHGHSGTVHNVAFSPDGRLVLSGSSDGTLIMWEVASGQALRTFHGYSGWMDSVAFSLDGKLALSGSSDGTLMLWEVVSSQMLRTFHGHSDWVRGVAFSPDGVLALSGSSDNTLMLWEVASGQALRTFHGHSGTVNSVAFSPDGTLALSGSSDGTLMLWEVASGQALRTFHGHSGTVSSVAFSPDGVLALSGSSDRALMLWDVASGQALRTFHGHSGTVYNVAFSPDGRLALSGSSDKTLMLWEVASGQMLRTFQGHSDWVNSVAFSPDGVLALSGSWDNTLMLWEVASGQVLRTFHGHSDWVNSGVFSPDGVLALSGSSDGTLMLWEVASGQALRTFHGHSGTVNSVAFSPDGVLALSGSSDNTLFEWRIDDLEALIAWTEAERYIQPLSCADRALYDLNPHCTDQTATLNLAWVTLAPSLTPRPTAIYTPTAFDWTPIPFTPPVWTALPTTPTLDLTQLSATPSLTPSLTNTPSATFTPQPTPTAFNWTPLPITLPVWTPIETPTPSNTPTPTITFTATIDATRTTLTPTQTFTPTVTPESVGEAQIGENDGEIGVGSGQIWTYQAIAGETLTVRVSADNPASGASDAERRERGLLDTLVIVRAPDGTLVADPTLVPSADDIVAGENTDSLIENLILTQDGLYEIEVRSWNDETGGVYTLIIESNRAPGVTPTPTP